MTIRHETASDQGAVFRVEREAFGRDEEALLVDALKDGGKVVLSLVAEDDGRIVGHILFSAMRIESESGSCAALCLGPLAVVPDRQRQGVGAALMEAALRELRSAGHRAVWLAGHTDYYPRFGFRPARQFDVHFEDDRDSLMLLELYPGALQGVSGRVVLAEEFARFA